jgi:hypothetical protein
MHPRRTGGSCSTSRPSPYGGELSRSAERAQTTATPRAVAAAAHSSANRVLPMPASPVHNTRRPRPVPRLVEHVDHPSQLTVAAKNDKAAVPSSGPATTTE